MGIGYHVVEALIRESQYRPLSGDVVLIGRQTVYFTPESIVELLGKHGIEVNVNPADIETGGGSTNNLANHYSKKLITDAALFRLLGMPKVQALDHSDYEGAEIIHNLTKPLPPNLEGCADFIVDGSTLDNVFDPAMVIRNFAAMLKPGGRLITTNMMSNHYEPYAILPPLWYLDYFVANGFIDCKVYIVVYRDGEGTGADVFTIDVDALLDPGRVVSAFVSPRMMCSIVFAEKGPSSTSNTLPSQQHYRSAAEWKTYRSNLAAMKTNKRPHIIRTSGEIDFTDVRGGYLFMSDDFTARDITIARLELESRSLAEAQS